MIKVTGLVNLRSIYAFQLEFKTPYFFNVSFEEWKTSFEDDIDGEGRGLFKELNLKAAYDEDRLMGFIQYGNTAFGFDDKGGVSEEVSYPIIRNFYFAKDREDVGLLLLNEAMESFEKENRVYAFFHYFGMSCFARHGKLFENHTHIDQLLRSNGFDVEHENVYYSFAIEACEDSDVVLIPNNLTIGGQQSISFIVDNMQVGGCEVHYLNNYTAYLRWIYVNSGIAGKGVGTRCMKALKHFLFRKGIYALDTDTAINNLVAQHYYEKNEFVREGITRSYYLYYYD